MFWAKLIVTGILPVSSLFYLNLCIYKKIKYYCINNASVINDVFN